MHVDRERALPIIKAALKEDIGKNDLTTRPLIPETSSSRAVITAHEDCVVCGIEIAEMVMSTVDYSVRFKPNCDEGADVGEGKEVAFLEGSTAAILRAERTMLNFMTFLSGIATKTRAYRKITLPYGTRIMDTRKTIPLLRYLEKYAVTVGGGTNHRMGLYDQVLIKDNHIFFRKQRHDGSESVTLKDLVVEARKSSPKGTIVEIEVASLEEFSDALAGKPDIIMLDNMEVDHVKACIEIRKISKSKPLLEVSGGINLDTVEKYARTGVDMISVGELTDSVSAIDMSLHIV